MYKQRYEQSDAAAAQPQQAQPQVQPQGTTVPEPMRIPAPRRQMNPSIPHGQPQPSPEPAQQPQVQAQQAPAEPSYDAQLMQQLATERRMFAEREAQYQQLFAQQAQALQELETLKSQQALQAQLADDKSFEGLETVDADDARRLISTTATVLQQPLNEMKKDLEAQRNALIQQQQYMNQQVAQLQSQRAREELLAAHPDFFDLWKKPDFVNYMRARDGHSSETREQRAVREYNMGNADFVVHMLNDYKGVAPQVQDIQTPAPVQVAQNMAPQQPQPTASYTLSDLLNLFQTRQISHDQYRTMLNNLRAAQAATPA